MGISSAPEIYQRAMESIFSDIDYIEIVMDIMLVHGPSLNVQNERLEKALERKVKLKLNRNKTQIAQPEVNFVGNVLSKDGLKPSPQRVETIVNMKEPENIGELETALGMIAYVSKFIPHLSDLNAPLRELKLKKEWSWGPVEKIAFQNIKDALTSIPVLKYYDASKPVLVSVDASMKGLGAAIIQNGGVVAFASRALSPTEQRYAQVEKEMLAVVFGCTRFHQLIYGNKCVTVESDHKPLENLFKKPMHAMPMRIQRMMLKLQPYTLTLKYVKGTCIGLADCLSRFPLPADPKSDPLIDEELMVCRVETLSYPQHDKIAEASRADEELRAVKSLIFNGWPETRKEVTALAVQYWEYRDELCCYDHIVYRGQRVCIPKTLRAETLKTIHTSHQGIVRSKQRARDIVFWPGMSKQIEDTCSKCPICLTHRNQNPREPMIPHEVPEQPWSKVGCDLFEISGEQYLTLVDYFSGFIEVAQLPDTRTSTMINHIKTNIARYGIMDVLVSDNGPQFASVEFRKFAESYKIQLTTCSPYHQQANGLAEKSVKTMKALIKKVREDGGDFYLALLDLRNTPRDSVIGSPMQRLMGRRARTFLPTTSALLQPKWHSPKIVREHLESYRDQQKGYYDRGTRQLPEIKPGDAVRMKTPQGWKPAKYIQQHNSTRSHIVVSGDQVKTYRRNRNVLMCTNEPPHDIVRKPPQPYYPATNIQLSHRPPPHVSRKPPSPQPPPMINPSGVTVRTRLGREIRRPVWLKDYD